MKPQKRPYGNPKQQKPARHFTDTPIVVEKDAWGFPKWKDYPTRCDRSVYDTLLVTNNWDKVTCPNCRRYWRWKPKLFEGKTLLCCRVNPRVHCVGCKMILCSTCGSKLLEGKRQFCRGDIRGRHSWVNM